MQNIRSWFFLIVVSFFNAVDVVAMQPIQAIAAMKATTKIPSLEKLCINVLEKEIKEGNLATLITSQKMEKFSLIPEDVSKKITAKNFCHQFGHEFVYKTNSKEVNGKKFGYEKTLDELNHQVMVIEAQNTITKISDTSISGTWLDEDKDTLKTFAINGKELYSLSLSHPIEYAHKNQFLYHIDSKKITIIKNGVECIGSYQCPIKYCSLKGVGCNQQELHLHNVQLNSRDGGKHSLFNFATQTMIHTNIDFIKFNKSGTVCLVKNGKTVTITDETSGTKIIKLAFADVQEVNLSPNGELLFVLCDNQPARLIRVNDRQEIFSFADIEGQTRVSSGLFSDDGRYLFINQFIPYKGLKKYMLDTQSGAICMSLDLSHDIHIHESFVGKYFVLRYYDQIDRSYSICLLSTNDLSGMCSLQNQSFPHYTLKDLIDRGIGKVFTHFASFHPSGDFIVTQDEQYTRNLVDIKSGAIVLTLTNVRSPMFSEPTGKIMCVEDPQEKRHKVFFLRNDFTMAEYVLTRFMSEKNI